MSFTPSPSSLPSGRLRVCITCVICVTCNGCVCYDCLLWGNLCGGVLIHALVWGGHQGDRKGPRPTPLHPRPYYDSWRSSYTCPCIRQYFPYLEVLYRSSQDKKTMCHYRSKSMWYTNLCKLHWTVSKICVTLVLGPEFYVNYVSFSAYLREQPTSFPLNTSLGALA